MNLKRFFIVGIIVGNFLQVMQPQAKEQESFLAQPTTRKQKKKKSIATLRQEFVEACEEYAHAIIREIFTISSLMSRTMDAKKREQLMESLQKRYPAICKAERFFMAGECFKENDNVKDEVARKGDEGVWRLMGLYAQLQEKLLYAITDILEQREASCFMTNDKQKLQKYQEQLLFLQEESELLVKELQAMSNQATLKK